MPDARIVRARGSHLYPGARVTVEGGLPGTPGPCLVAFADGAAATGSLTPDGAGGAMLETTPYRTAAGTAVAAKSWRLVPESGGIFRLAAPSGGRRPR